MLQMQNMQIFKEKESISGAEPQAVVSNPTVIEPVDVSAADEPDTAPVWYVTFALFFGAGLLILAMMVLMLCCLQIVVNGREETSAGVVEI